MVWFWYKILIYKVTSSWAVRYIVEEYYIAKVWNTKPHIYVTVHSNTVTHLQCKYVAVFKIAKENVSPRC